MSRSKFYDKIKDATIERQVEDVYNEGINFYFPTQKGIEYPFACDGFVDTKVTNNNGTNVLKFIIEYKFNESLKNTVSRAKILIQVIYYMKRFEENGMILPNVCMVGDKDECFVLHTNELQKYLDEDGVDWTISPSQAAINGNNADLILKVSQDTSINPFIFDVNENFSLSDVADRIKDLAHNVQRYVRVTEHNLSVIFDYFCKHVLNGRVKLSGHDLVEIFIGVISDKANCYLHPTKANTLVCNMKEVHIDGSAFKSFFGYFDRNYTPQETMRIKGIADRLIEDADRRMKGDFWTPTLFVDYAHKMLEDELGDDWKDKFVVWDNCWGTGNLTRDYKFGELYCSTLFQSELNIGADYNMEATKFQFDFLNDDIPTPTDLVQVQTKLPQGLVDALKKDKPIVFLLNPPYAQAVSGNGKNAKKGCADTAINQIMVSDGMANGSRNLYAQFLYRIMLLKQAYGLTNCYIGLYSPTLFLAGTAWTAFRQKFFNEFEFVKACQFSASHFSDVKDSWGISFSVWKSGITSNKNDFLYDCIDDVDGEIQIINTKNVYNVDGAITASDWAKPTQPIIKKEFVYLTSALKPKESNDVKAYLSIDSIGGFVNGANNVDKNPTQVYLLTGSIDTATGAITYVTPSNYERVISVFSARKLIEKNWVNSKDEYIAPNETHCQYNEFVNDSIVYSLFNTSSNQSSLRQIEYKGKKWDIYNEFFWMLKDEIHQLANNNNLSFTYNDARTSKERYVYTKLQTVTLSTEAQAVLNKANDIVKNTFKYRELFDSEHPEYQIMNWDCGWYQIRALAKEYDKTEYDEFVELYKKLADKMRPMVYTLGFLK